MEGHGSIEKLGFEVESKEGIDDEKFVSKYSAILVATIQEAKDRISQVEYVFCERLYSHFQFQSKSLNKLYKDKEKDFVRQIDDLFVENRILVEENRKRAEDNRLLKDTNRENRIDELENEVRRKSKEIDEGIEAKNRLLELVQSKETMVLENGKALKEREERICELELEVNSLEKKVDWLNQEVKAKTEKVADKKEMCDSLNKHVLKLMDMVADGHQLLTALEKEKKNWGQKMEVLEGNVSELKKKLEKKTKEVEGVELLRSELAQQIDTTKMELMKQKQKVEDSEKERTLIMEKVKRLERENSELMKDVSMSAIVVSEGKDLHEKLLRQIEEKDSQLLALKKNQRDFLDAYKRLKSQYNYVCKKYGLTEENMLPQSESEDESGPSTDQKNLRTSPDSEGKHIDASEAICEIKKVKVENEATNGVENDKLIKPIPMSTFQSPTFNCVAPKCPLTAKSAPLIGTKRRASRWIETRSRQNRDGPDPHDDFFNTPLENVREALSKATKQKDHDLQIPLQNAATHDSSDDETQDMNADPLPEKPQMPLPVDAQKGFKYVEPVRKKAERENLQGVECKQCKKFYDAVLPDGGKDGDGSKNLLCEHHEGVSRHRYKYLPPLTPEGFWNIGFESEM